MFTPRSDTQNHANITLIPIFLKFIGSCKGRCVRDLIGHRLPRERHQPTHLSLISLPCLINAIPYQEGKKSQLVYHFVKSSLLRKLRFIHKFAAIRKSYKHIAHFLLFFNVVAICINIFQYTIHSYYQGTMLTQKTRTIIVDKNAVSSSNISSKEININDCWYDIVSIQEQKSSYRLNVICDQKEEMLNQHAKKHLLNSCYFMAMYFEEPLRFEFAPRPFYSKKPKSLFVPKFQNPFFDVAWRPPCCA